MDYFSLMRNFWDFCFENPQKIKPQHCALYCFTVEHCNRLGWKKNFGLPTEMAKEAIGIRSYNSYISTLNDLIDFGFLIMVEKSKNQYSSNIIALSNYDKALYKALDKAFIKHDTKQCESIYSIDKQIYNNTNIQLKTDSVFSFDEFWSIYPKKSGKHPCSKKYEKLSETDRKKIKETLSDFIKYKPFPEYSHPNPLTYINQKRWNDELIINLNNIPNERYTELATAILTSDPTR